MRTRSRCFVSHAIAPRDAWAESKLGEWYWDELPKALPWWRIAWTEEDNDVLASLGPFLLPWERPKPPPSEEEEAAAPAARNRAEPRIRPFSSGANAPQPCTRPLTAGFCWICPLTECPARCAPSHAGVNSKPKKEALEWYDG